MQVHAVPFDRAPSAGEHACGHGVRGVIIAVPRSQPLAGDGVWRVTLAGESVGRLVCASPDGGWHLLQLDELTDAQQDALDAASDAPRDC